MFKNKHDKQKGFTLIELLVVILVISVLSGLILGVINASGVRGKARDGKRKADLAKIQSALELYFVDNRSYPVTNPSYGDTWVNLSETTLLTGELVPNYISVVPQEPCLTESCTYVGNNGPCASPTGYRYNFTSDGQGYIITAMMEVASSNDDSMCVDLNNWTVTSLNNYCPNTGIATEDVCYGVENP